MELQRFYYNNYNAVVLAAVGCPIPLPPLVSCEIEITIRIGISCETDQDCIGDELCCMDYCNISTCTLPAAICQDDSGGRYQLGESFIAEDGCNLW